MSYARWDVVVVPFPFTDRPVRKRRPALVLSGADWNAASGHVVCAMITTGARSCFPGDVAVANLGAAGLEAACVVRWKLFTIEAGLVVRRAGSLGEGDRAAVEAAMGAVFWA